MNAVDPSKTTVPSSRFAAVSLSQLQCGATLTSPIYDDRSDHNVLLLAAGLTITQDLLDRLKTRNVTTVRVSEDDLHTMGQLCKQSRGNRDVFTAVSTDRRIRPESLIHRVHRPGAVPYEAAEVQRVVDNYDRSLDQVGSFFVNLGRGRAEGEVARKVSVENIVQLVRDADLFVSLGLRPNEDHYAPRHSLQAMILALSIGTTLGLTEDELIDLGMGTLTHDAGMLLIDHEIWQKPRRLTAVERLEISKHPTSVFEQIVKNPAFSAGARMVVYQMHERFDGSGYPRQRSGQQIHLLARVAAVADVYVALVSPRPYRRAMIPYLAMEQIVQATRQGKFDPEVVRAFLRTVSLFPISSCVLVNDGRVGRVIRSNDDAFAQPVVDLWAIDAVGGRPETIDLSTTPDLHVSRPLTKFEAVELGLA